MKPFGYGFDPLCLASCALYALNRWVMKPHFASPFLHNYFNDLWLIPCALPWVLWIQRKLTLRRDDTPPAASEILFHLIIWSLLFELFGPHIMRHTVGDPWDIAAYCAGAVGAARWWRRPACPATSEPRHGL